MMDGMSKGFLKVLYMQRKLAFLVCSLNSATDLCLFRSDLKSPNELIEKLLNTRPGVDTVRSIQHDHKVHLLPALWNRAKNDI